MEHKVAVPEFPLELQIRALPHARVKVTGSF